MKPKQDCGAAKESKNCFGSQKENEVHFDCRARQEVDLNQDLQTVQNFTGGGGGVRTVNRRKGSKGEQPGDLGLCSALLG